MTTTKNRVADTQQPALTRAVIRATGLDNLADIAEHGATAGFAGFTYHRDTVAFFQRHRALIVSRVKSLAEECGENPLDMVCTFSCLGGRNKPEAREQYSESVARCLFGGQLTDQDDDVANALAWFAAEDVAREMHPDI